MNLSFGLVSFSSAGDRYDSNDSRTRWDDDWDKSKGQFPFSEKLGEISDKIGSTIGDTIDKFRKKDRDESPDRFRLVTNPSLRTARELGAKNPDGLFIVHL